MAKTITIKLPDRLHAAVVNKAKHEFEQEAPEFLRTFLFIAADSKDGATLKLDLPPPSNAPDPQQDELPLGGVESSR